MVDDLANSSLQGSWNAGSPSRPRGGSHKNLNEGDGVACKGSPNGRGNGWIGEDGRGLRSGSDEIDIVYSFLGVHKEIIERVKDWSRDCRGPGWGHGRRIQGVCEADWVTLVQGSGRGKGGGHDSGDVGFEFGICSEDAEEGSLICCAS